MSVYITAAIKIFDALAVALLSRRAVAALDSMKTSCCVCAADEQVSCIYSAPPLQSVESI